VAYDPSKDTALAILREFVADCLAVGNNDPAQTFDQLSLVQDWPDLAITFERAYAFVEYADRHGGC
jgi:hypothetical protein